MLRRLPLIPTLLVMVAVGVMLRLGFWQIDRLHQKEALLARFAAAAANPAELPQGDASLREESNLYRKARTQCLAVNGISAMAGHNARGETGWAQVARCELIAGDEIDVVLGWSDRPQTPGWSGGEVHGTLAPGTSGPRLIADPPLAGLAANARPDPKDLPNNHLAYAVQWFLFAATALVIYGLALRKRLAAGGAEG